MAAHRLEQLPDCRLRYLRAQDAMAERDDACDLRSAGLHREAHPICRLAFYLFLSITAHQASISPMTRTGFHDSYRWAFQRGQFPGCRRSAPNAELLPESGHCCTMGLSSGVRDDLSVSGPHFAGAPCPLGRGSGIPFNYRSLPDFAEWSACPGDPAQTSQVYSMRLSQQIVRFLQLPQIL